MTKITSLHLFRYRKRLSYCSTIARTATGMALITSSAALMPVNAQAQTYIGNAYTTKAGAASFLDLDLDPLNTTTAAVAANASLFDTGILNGPQQYRTGLEAGALADLSLATSSALGGIGLGNLVDAGVTTTETDSRTGSIPAGTAVQSTASVATLKLGSNTSLTGLLLQNSLVTATAIQSQTSAFFSGSTFGTTTLTDFNLNGLTAAQLGIIGTVGVGGTLTVTQQQTIAIYDNFFLSGVGQGTQIGTLTINEQILGSLAPGALTTNALHLRLNSDLGLLSNTLSSLAGADVIVSSSTAGFTPAAPEPGSLAFLLPVMGGAGMVSTVLRRRRRKGGTTS